MGHSIVTCVMLLFLHTPLLVETSGLKSIYTLQCGPNNYIIISMVDFFELLPYTLYAPDRNDVVAGPWTSNVFANMKI